MKSIIWRKASFKIDWLIETPPDKSAVAVYFHPEMPYLWYFILSFFFFSALPDSTNLSASNLETHISV